MSGEQRLVQAFVAGHPEDVARRLESLPPAQVAPLLEEIPADQASSVLQRMAPSIAADSLAASSSDTLGRLLAVLPLDLAAALLRRLGPQDQERLLAAAPEEISSTLSFLHRFPEHTAGALMDPKVLAVPEDINVREARARMRQAAHQVLYYLYVVDRSHKLVGVLNVRELLLAQGRQLMTTVMQPHVARLSVHADRQAIVTHPGWREFHALPVVDEEDRLVGAVRYKTLRSLEEELQAGPPPRSPLMAVFTLGELYWVAIGGLIQALGSSSRGLASPLPQGGKPNDT